MKVHIENARVSFANGLFVASSASPEAKKKYGADFIMDEKTKVFAVVEGKKVAKPIKWCELEAAKVGWKANAQRMLDGLEPSKKALRDGSTRLNKAGEVYDGYDGHWYVTAKSATRPTIVNKDRSPLSEEDGVIYSGCRVNVIIEFYCNTMPNKKGVFAGLKAVQFCGDDESFGGGSPASADEFDDVSEGADAEDFA